MTTATMNTFNSDLMGVDSSQYIPVLYKIVAMCDIEKNRTGHKVGGKKKDFKLLALDADVYEDVVNRSDMLLDIIHKEYPGYSCEFTCVEKVRNIPISVDLVSETDPCKISTANRAISELASITLGKRFEDPVIIIRNYNLDKSECDYAMMDGEGLHFSEL